jgi:hypothetical protein
MIVTAYIGHQQSYQGKAQVISIMDELVTEEDEQEMNNKEKPYNEGADRDCSQAFFWPITN